MNPISENTRAAARAMRRGGATRDHIAVSLGVSTGWVSKFLRGEGQAAERRAPAANIVASTLAAEAAEATTARAPHVPQDAPGDNGGPDVADVPPGAPGELRAAARSIAADIATIEAQRTALEALDTCGMLGPDRVRVASTIGQLTARLALLRREQRSILAPETDAAVRQAGAKAAAKFRKLLEEEILALAAESAPAP